MRGPPPTPTVVRLMRGNPSRRPINRNEPQPARTEKVPDAPDFLVGYACDEWHRVAPELHLLGLLTVLDIMPLAAYCQSCARSRTAEELIAKMAAKDEATNGLLVKGPYGDARQNPLVKIARNAASDMVGYANQFGMGPAARARISVGVGHEPPSKFGDLLA
jgi:P27 family predicted phage terminase small subunit